MKDSESTQTVYDPTIPEHELRLECSIRIWGRDEEIVNIQPKTAYPLGLHPSISPMTVSHISKFLEILVIEPVQVMLNLRERRLFEQEAREMEARIKAGGGGKANPISAPDPGTQFRAPSPEFTEPFEDNGLGFAQMPSPDFGPPLPEAEPIRPVKASRSPSRAPRQPARPPMDPEEAAERSRAA